MTTCILILLVKILPYLYKKSQELYLNQVFFKINQTFLSLLTFNYIESPDIYYNLTYDPLQQPIPLLHALQMPLIFFKYLL